MELNDDQKKLYDDLSPLEQRLAIALLEGVPPLKAYLYADPLSKMTNHVAGSTCTRIRQQPRFRAFIASVNHALLSPAIMDRDELAQRLSEIARAKLSDIIMLEEFNHGTAEHPDIRMGWRLTPELIKNPELFDNVAEIHPSAQGPKVKMYSAVDAAQKLAVMMGYVEKTTVNLTSDDGSMTPTVIDFSKLSDSTLQDLLNASEPPGDG